MGIVQSIKDKLSPDYTEAEQVAKYRERVNSLAKARAKWEAKWYENDAFADGRHFTMYRRSTGKLVNIDPGKNEVFRVHHKAHRKLKDIQNTILSNEPQWQALPQTAPNTSTDDAVRVNDWLQDFYQRKNVKIKLSDLVMLGLKMSYAALWHGYDRVTGEFYVDVHDAFDILFTGDIYDIQDAPTVIKQFVKDLDAIKANPYYKNTDELKADNRFAASEMKNQRFKEKFANGHGSDGQNNVTGYEIWEKMYISDETRAKVKQFEKQSGEWDDKPVEAPEMDENGKPVLGKDGQPVMTKQTPTHWTDQKPDGAVFMHKVCIFRDSDKIHAEEYFDFSYYPVAIWHAEAGLLLQPAWIERIMSMNRSYDVIQSRVEQWINTVVSGRLVASDMSDIKQVDNDMGVSVMTYAAGSAEPHWEVVPPLPATVIQHLATLDRGMDEMTVYAAQIASLAQGGGGRGARLMEIIRQADMVSVKASVDNLASTLEQSATILLALADYNLSQAQTVYHTQKQNGKLQPDYFQVIGGRYRNTAAYETLDAQGQAPTVLDASQKVMVTIDTSGAQTPGAMQDLYLQLAQLGKIPDQVLWEELLKRTNTEELAKEMKAQQPATSMIDTPDFQAMPDHIKMAAAQAGINQNLSIPRDANALVKKMGSLKKQTASAASES